jgi:DNA-binding CsgD family transcriptional regulator
MRCLPDTALVQVVSLDDIAEGMLHEGFLAEVVASIPDQETGARLERAGLPDMAFDELLDRPPETRLEPRQAVAAAISALSPKEHEVVLRRYGLQDFAPHTLEQVAEQFFVTRERVRQIEKKALKFLARGERVTAFRSLLAAEQCEAWRLLSGESGFVLPSDLQQASTKLDGVFHLAADVIHGGLKEWVTSHGAPACGGWVAPESQVSRLPEDVAAVRAWSRSAPGPCPIDAVTTHLGIPEDRLRTALRVVNTVHLFEGYVCVGYLGSQARRTCRLHRLALGTPVESCVGGALFDFASLLNLYRMAVPDDGAASRVIVLQLERAPHLFFNLFDHLWIALDPSRPLPEGRALQAIPVEQCELPDKNDFEAGSIGWVLYEFLAAEGPKRLVDLRDWVPSRLTQEVSDTSVGAVLHSNPCFVRLAPGVFGLQRHAAAAWQPASGKVDVFLSEKHCRYYAMAQEAGVPAAFYPAWTVPLEAKLCEWAERSATTEVFRSLLAVCALERWPIDEAERARWAALRQTHASYKLTATAQPALSGMPKASDFSSAVQYLAHFGEISWVAINRTAQRRLDNQAAASTLALLVAMGLAHPAAHWQGRHSATPSARTAARRIAHDLFWHGGLTWDAGILAELLREAKVRDIGWCQSADAENLFSIEQRDTPAWGERAVGLGDLDAVFGGDDWARGFDD